MSRDFKKCLENKKLVPFAGGIKTAGKELAVAMSDLSDAKNSYENGSYKWSTVQAYYAMFHDARALVYSRGYREKSHYCLAVALRELFVDSGIMNIRLVRDFTSAMNLREAADYGAEFSGDGAVAVMASAGKFVEKVKEIMGDSK